MNNQDLNNQIRKIDEKVKEIDQKINSLKAEKNALLQEKEHLGLSHANSKHRETVDFENGKFPWSATVKQLLTKTFKVNDFRPLQLKTINATLSGRDCILIKPTGGGKSLCYQLASLISGFSLVITPLVSLMHDQIMLAERYGIKCASLDASCPIKTQNEIYKAMETNPIDNIQFKLIFVTPEKVAKSKKFKQALEKAYADKRISRIVIDEIHCCSQWGHDFRPDYNNLHIFKSIFPDIPILGLTATATDSVINDIKEILSLDFNLLIFRDKYNRPNLYYDVKYLTNDDSESKEVCSMIKTTYSNDTGIVYCFSQKDCERISNDLKSSGIQSSYYHANLTSEERTSIHQKWFKGECKVIVATIAFGMGIDKENVRFVIHASMSKSMENYYQESGRAGRDGKRADCILLWKLSDYFKLGSNVFQERRGIVNLNMMCRYALDVDACKRVHMARIFQDQYVASDCKKMCCRCKEPRGVILVDIREVCVTALSIIKKVEASKNPKITGNKLANDLMEQMKTFQERLLKDHPGINLSVTFDKALCHLALEGYLKLDCHFGSFKNFTYILVGEKKLNDKEEIWFKVSGATGKSAAGEDAQSGSHKRKAVLNEGSIIASKSSKC